MKKYLCLILIICMLGGGGIVTYAASLYACSLELGIASGGLGISYTTQFSAIASEVGVKDIVLYEKIGNTWHTYSIPQTSATNTSAHSAGGTYTNAVRGRTYKATCTHYAVYGGVTYTLGSSTREFVYN